MVNDIGQIYVSVSSHCDNDSPQAMGPPTESLHPPGRGSCVVVYHHKPRCHVQWNVSVWKLRFSVASSRRADDRTIHAIHLVVCIEFTRILHGCRFIASRCLLAKTALCAAQGTRHRDSPAWIGRGCCRDAHWACAEGGSSRGAPPAFGPRHHDSCPIPTSALPRCVHSVYVWQSCPWPQVVLKNNRNSFTNSFNALLI